MNRSNPGKGIVLALGLMLASSGCAWVSVDPGAAEKVGVASAISVEDCKKVGSTRARTRNKIGLITRDREKIEDELEILARNEAPGLGGNVVQPEGPIEVVGRDAVRKFQIFSCGPK